ncbi:MAG: flagellar hook-length control protein FliK [Deltaproteobacteria bacterium]|jgi:hypothetical protein|nr:flagellar hook-length control protein FliK [Deltaproteobacteria bacterium]
MNSLAITSTPIEYREISLLDNLSGREDDFQVYLDQARAARDKISEKARIKGDIREARSDSESERLAAEKFGARRKKAARQKLEVFQAQVILPQNITERVSQSLIGGGQLERGIRGWELSGQERPSTVLKGLLDNLKGEGDLWNLDRDCLPALGRIMLASGAEADKVTAMMAKLTQGPLTLDRVMKEVSQMETDLSLAQKINPEANGVPADLAAFLGENAPSSLGQTQLTVNDAGLGAMGQYFLSLGLSAESVKAVTSQLKPGESFTAQSLRKLFGEMDEPLAPCLADGDLGNLMVALKAMGAKSESLNLFSQYLTQAPDAKLDDLLGFLAVLETPQPKLIDSANLVKDVQALIAGSSRETELAKAPIFNEIILKLSALGDRQMADDFAELSPALQALRGGISGQRAGGEGMGGQNHHQGARDQEKERLALSGLKSPTLSQGLDGSGFTQALGAELGGYGARESLAKQLERKLTYSARQGVHRLRMDLDPEELGRLDVELKVKNDKLTAHIRAETAEAYEALEREISSLKASLKESGLEMTLTLSFDGQEEKDRHFSRSDNPRIITGVPGGETETQPTSPILTAQAERLLDKVI